MTKFTIDPVVAGIFPGVKIGLLACKSLENHSIHPEIVSLLRKEEALRRNFTTLEQLLLLPKINDWREAYRTFGFKPSSYRSSVEALLRRVVQGKELPAINNIVDLYNLISIKRVLPAGGDDLDMIEGDITLTIANGSEYFLMLGSEKPEEIKKGEVVYRDQKEVLCRAWNYRECEKSKITEKTKNVCLVLEGLEHTSKEEILSGIKELKALLSKYCKGHYQEFYLDKSSLECSFS